ncbi:MAG: VWA domain-containing protein [Verrucomicrobia bacterium]|nr:VWA domain-containing protein [Verrucomicrobiota bacterium]
MNFRLTDPWWLLLWLVAVPWTLYFHFRSDVGMSAFRKWLALGLRLFIVTLTVLSIAGLQHLKPVEGMNVFFVLDRSDSVPSPQQEAARQFVNQTSALKKKEDRGGVVVFGSSASIESSANPVVHLQKIHSVLSTERTDLAGAIRLAAAAFPETGQKRIVLISDGNENVGDAAAAAYAAGPLGISIDVLPLGAARKNDTSIQKLSLPPQLKKGQTFDVKIFAQADRLQSGKVRLYRNDQLLGEQQVTLDAGKNLFSFPQTLTEPGFYSYEVQLDAPGDMVPQNNRATSFTSVKGDPRILLVSSAPEQDANLADVLRSAQFDLKVAGINGFPGNLAEMQSYDAIFLSNVAAGDLGLDLMRLLESAVRDFGIGLVCIGGDQAFAAGGYRGTPLESALPLDMELSSKKVLPSGAMVIVCHATEFPNGNQWARDIAFAALDALGPQDEMGIVMWDGTDRWLFELAKVADKKAMGRAIAGMNPGDMPNFQRVMEMANEGLKKSNASIKHMVVFSDGDPGAPDAKLMSEIVGNRITLSTVMIGGHVNPDTMMDLATKGKGQFYDVRSPASLPQIFVKEAAVILKSAIFEEPFKPRLASSSELTRGIGGAEFPMLRGYVATSPKPRAEVPLVSDKGDPVLAHWQFGLGRAVAFTSDAKARWAAPWLSWDRYRQFWIQVAQWSLRRLENSEFNTDISIEKGEGILTVEAVDSQGNFRNFLNLQTVVVGPKGEKQTVRLQQSGPGHYEARFPTKEVGMYLLNLLDFKDGVVRSRQSLGTSVNYSPEFNASEPNTPLLGRLAETTGGKMLDLERPEDSPFLHDRKKTHQPRDLWEWLLKLAIVLFPLDIAVRRIQPDWEEWKKATRSLRRFLFFWEKPAVTPDAEESLGALLARRDEVRARRPASTAADPEIFKPRDPAGSNASVLGDFSTPRSEPTAQPSTPTGQATVSAPEQAGEEAGTTSKLLAAKRRAQKRNL